MVTYLKYISFIVIGFIVGVFSTQYVLHKSTAAYEEAYFALEDAFSNRIAETDLIVMRQIELRLRDLNDLLESEKNGSSVQDFIIEKQDDLESDFTMLSEGLETTDNEEVAERINYLSDYFYELNSEIEFLYGISN